MDAFLWLHVASLAVCVVPVAAQHLTRWFCEG